MKSKNIKSIANTCKSCKYALLSDCFLKYVKFNIYFSILLSI